LHRGCWRSHSIARFHHGRRDPSKIYCGNPPGRFAPVARLVRELTDADVARLQQKFAGAHNKAKA
jgi:hypothetical protein